MKIFGIDVSKVATREGGVDRNNIDAVFCALNAGSPPARVAWIETITMNYANEIKSVATREGGVDRNNSGRGLDLKFVNVATREGGVDRNTSFGKWHIQSASRHPRGWRG